MILIYTTTPNEKTAKSIATHLLEQNLVACANLHPITSMYKWKGELKDESEVALILKTSKEKFEKIKQEITTIHPYEVPCILKMPVQANEKFAKWAKKLV